MVQVKYPEHVEAQLKQLDEKIEKIYAEELPKENTAAALDYSNILRIKRNLYERIRPLLDEKVRLIENCVPTYICKPEKPGFWG